MSFSALFAKFVALIGSVLIVWRRATTPQPSQAIGQAPSIPLPRSQGVLPTLKMPTAKGWTAGHLPTAAPGLKLNAFATGLKHPRWIEVLPNGDVAVAEALFTPGGISSVFDYAMQSTMRRAAAIPEGPTGHGNADAPPPDCSFGHLSAFRWPIYFFPKASFKSSFCIDRSANIRFNRRFSSSSAFFSDIIDASIPPYLERHL